jgi:hypothetical protein
MYRRLTLDSLASDCDLITFETLCRYHTCHTKVKHSGIINRALFYCSHSLHVVRVLQSTQHLCSHRLARLKNIIWSMATYAQNQPSVKIYANHNKNVA